MGRNFKNIKAWQLADRLVLQIYQTTKQYPNHELYGIISQLRRAVVSIPCNIVEGSAKTSKKDYLRFLEISMGSLAEVEYLILLSRNLNYISQDQFDHIEKLRTECIKTLQGLISFIKSEVN